MARESCLYYPGLNVKSSPYYRMVISCYFSPGIRFANVLKFLIATRALIFKVELCLQNFGKKIICGTQWKEYWNKDKNILYCRYFFIYYHFFLKDLFYLFYFRFNPFNLIKRNILKIEPFLNSCSMRGELTEENPKP